MVKYENGKYAHKHEDGIHYYQNSPSVHAYSLRSRLTHTITLQVSIQYKQKVTLC